ncbi:helix-turn-helix domain-containing protein [Enterococcus sp. DIV0800]|uniref:helix-turn-helix domain-containing protein n=1 Tax=unclassified Enterococcus TaxID=2608891 RepID=UPI003D300CFA
MYHGEVVRKIRINKGLTQKEVYSGIVSKSYAIEFEKGNHSISATLLLDILERVSIDMDEFLYISQGYHLPEQADYIFRYSKYSNDHDLLALKQLLVELQSYHGKIAEVRIAEVRSRIRIIEAVQKTGKYTPAVVLEEDKVTIIHYLTNLQTWTLQEIQLFANTLEFIDAEKQLIFFKQLSKSLELYLEYDRGREIFCSLLVNLIRETLDENLLDYADVLIEQLFLLTTDYKELFQRLCAKFFKGILKMKHGDPAGWKETQRVLSILYELDHLTLAKELESLL